MKNKLLAVFLVLITVSTLSACRISPFKFIRNDENLPISDSTQYIEVDSDLAAPNLYSKTDPENYFKLSTLSLPQQSLYKSFVDNIIHFKNFVEVSNCNLNKDEIMAVFNAVRTDYPQFFWVDRTLTNLQNGDGVIKAVSLHYCDGTNIDKVAISGQRIYIDSPADRNEIIDRIEKFNTAIDGYVSDIPSDITDAQKELILHDLVINNLVYDDEAAALINDENSSPAYNSYGAACDKLAVCEGYSKLFQYLCYRVGLNCTSVSGTAKSETDGGTVNHMWNAVCIENEWYMVDTTWDDSVENMPYYHYFNITTDELLKDHTIDPYDTNIPKCNSDKFSKFNTAVLYAENSNTMPKNYISILNRIERNGLEYCIVYNGTAEDNNKFLNKILSKNSEFVKYVNKNCSFKLSTDNIKIVDKYLYIPVK